MAEQGRADVAEVTTGDTCDDWTIGRLYQFFQTGVGIKVIECLWQETSHVDGVGRGESHVAVQLFVHKGRLHQSLAVVENPINLDSRYVTSKSRELTLLYVTDLALGVKHLDMDALYAEETIGHSRACVAAGRHEDVDLLGTRCFWLLINKVLQKTGHKTSSYILESKGRAVE